ncbi:DUF5686 family protein [Zunongwangia pacifica]|uniref:DUF5686 and carboxypeptidase regulatory-like domain-containing protein n=1 Tax=Zunongwangia pacifica TaxID=2911062 RepID=A0A9X1ZRM0_9FLAO|nr:DUF5686 family protein [Zunongwangia pacifica]MCL6218766.1 DUF5686 and carboxypeptidase regulatory-like domain-containing protein [Zunongwangia pacifica]
MRLVFTFLFIIAGFLANAQQIPGKVISAITGEPLGYAKITLPQNTPILSKIDGSFQLNLNGKESLKISVSYLGFYTREFTISEENKTVLLQLYPDYEKLNTVYISSPRNPANRLVEKAIKNREINDPRKALGGFEYYSYSKFLIDNDKNPVKLATDSTNSEIATIVNVARAYLSEKVTKHNYSQKQGGKDEVIGLKTAGFKKPIYDVLSLDIYPTSFYEDEYSIFQTEYAGPLAKNAFRNYEYRILDTINTKRPSYLVYFKPKREKVVAGLEGVIYLDTLNYGIQKTEARLIGEIDLEIHEDYEFNTSEKVWLLQKRDIKIRPGSGGKDISVFGGNISLGTIQRRLSISSIFNKDPIDTNLYLDATTANYDYQLNTRPQREETSAKIVVDQKANDRDPSFWNSNRKEPYTSKDEATAIYVDSIIKTRNIERKIEVKKAMANGYYPIAFWDLQLSKIFKYNNFEGIRLGIGGKTNDHLSNKFNIGGYFVYGFGDQKIKYNINTSIYLNKLTGTNLKFGYTKDIKEVASFDYLKAPPKFYLIEPRFVNINFFYNFKQYYAGLEHRITPQLSSEIRFSQTKVFDARDYEFLYNGELYQEYTISTAGISFSWEPFSEYLKTPESSILIERRFPRITAQIDKGFADVADGDFNFLRTGLKLEYTIKRLDLSRTEFILEGNYATGTLPLTHTFYAYPNSSRQEAILKRFSVAGKTSFETMYYNEFYSDRLAMLHMRHQLRPIKFSNFFQPEIVLISRHAIGDIGHMDRHQNIDFKSLDQAYSEVGLEINKIISGFGLSTAYRYGAYHLPGFSQNLAFKFTLNIKF